MLSNLSASEHFYGSPSSPRAQTNAQTQQAQDRLVLATAVGVDDVDLSRNREGCSLKARPQARGRGSHDAYEPGGEDCSDTAPAQPQSHRLQVRLHE